MSPILPMRNEKINIKEHQPRHLKKIREAYTEIIEKLFLQKQSGKSGSVYSRKLEKTAHKKFNIRGHDLVHAALRELRTNSKILRVNALGRIVNAAEIGSYFETLWRLMSKNVDVFVIFDEKQVDSPSLPLSGSYKAQFRKIILKNEAAAILLVKHPPEETSREIREVTKHCLHDLMSFWANEKFQQTADIRDNLKEYLEHATVRVFSTGDNPEVNKITAAVNEHLEMYGGFEDTHWLRVVKGITQDEKKESLKQALGVCVPIIVLIKILEKVVPGALHALGGALDDLFGAIIPDVSQSMGNKSLPFKQRLKNAWPVLKGGLVTLPLAFVLGGLSAILYNGSQSVFVHMAAGVMFALACCAGTLGTSFAAVRKAYRAVGQLEKDKKYGYLAANLTAFGRFKIAFKEAIMDVPFRVGHSVIGVPFQIGLGIAAGAFGFFNNSIFIMVEGMAETLLGAVTAFVYPASARRLRNLRLRRTEFD